MGVLEPSGDLADVGDLLALVQSRPDLWIGRLYGQLRTDTGGPGASIG